MRHASRVAAAARQARPQRALEQAQGAAAMATHATGVAVVHPPHQSVRPGFAKDDAPHTAKWMQAPGRSPQDWIASVAPVEVKHGNVARCFGGSEPALGHPVEFICLNDTSAEFPAVCKYCGLRYFGGGHGH